MPLLTQGKVIVTNWHVFEPQSVQTGGVERKVIKAGVPVRVQGNHQYRGEDHDGSWDAVSEPEGLRATGDGWTADRARRREATRRGHSRK